MSNISLEAHDLLHATMNSSKSAPDQIAIAGDDSTMDCCVVTRGRWSVHTSDDSYHSGMFINADNVIHSGTHEF